MEAEGLQGQLEKALGVLGRRGGLLNSEKLANDRAVIAILMSPGASLRSEDDLQRAREHVIDIVHALASDLDGTERLVLEVALSLKPDFAGSEVQARIDAAHLSSNTYSKKRHAVLARVARRLIVEFERPTWAGRGLITPADFSEGSIEHLWTIDQRVKDLAVLGLGLHKVKFIQDHLSKADRRSAKAAVRRNSAMAHGFVSLMDAALALHQLQSTYAGVRALELVDLRNIEHLELTYARGLDDLARYAEIRLRNSGPVRADGRLMRSILKDRELRLAIDRFYTTFPRALSSSRGMVLPEGRSLPSPARWLMKAREDLAIVFPRKPDEAGSLLREVDRDLVIWATIIADEIGVDALREAVTKTLQAGSELWVHSAPNYVRDIYEKLEDASRPTDFSWRGPWIKWYGY